MASLRAASVALCAGAATAANWAVITAGSKGWYNYRHQADACHAYQVMKANGVPDANIITMMYDDIANNRANPFPGQLFNRPDEDGPGTDVYAGCRIDHAGEAVTPERFLAVLAGDASAGKVLKSTAEDNVFVFFSDHGAPGLMQFPNDVLHVQDLQQSLQAAHLAGRFKKLVFYLETCESGSMFQDLDVPGVYALSAANSTESSWGAYCGDEAVVAGKPFGICLGDAFSVAWMEDADAKDLAQESLQAQFEIVRGEFNRSDVMQWGDLSFANDTLASFIGTRGPALGAAAHGRSKQRWKTKDQHLNALQYHYNRAKHGEDRMYWAGLMETEIRAQEHVEKVHRRFTAIAYPGDVAAQKRARRRQERPLFKRCELEGHRALKKHCKRLFRAQSGFALYFHQIIVNVCYDVNQKGLNLSVRGAIGIACEDPHGEVELAGEVLV